MARIPVALQLYSVRRELIRMCTDVEGRSRDGLRRSRIAGAPKHSPEVLRAILDEVGLVCCGWHIPMNLYSRIGWRRPSLS